MGTTGALTRLSPAGPEDTGDRKDRADRSRVRNERRVSVSLDTLRADHLSCLGNSRGLTPNLDRIASEGALFSQAYATDIPTQPSHTAMFTGQFGVKTGIVSHFHPAAYLDEETLWLPSELRRNGYIDRCGRPPLRHEGLVHPRLRRLHAARRAGPARPGR